MTFGNREEHVNIYDYEADFFSSVTTYHGLVRIYNATHWYGRWFWTIIVFTSFSLFVIQAKGILTQLAARPTLTTVDFKVPEGGLLFPYVTICNYNPIMISKIKSLTAQMDNETIEYISLSLASPEWFHDANAKSSYMKDLNLTDLYEHYSEYKKLFPRVNGGVPLNLFDLISNPHYGIGFTCQDMVKACYFGGVEIDDCCNYTNSIMTDYGKCFQFRQYGPKLDPYRQHISGAKFGFEIVLDTMQNESSPFLVRDIWDVGVKFTVHDDTSLPLMSFYGQSAMPGTKVCLLRSLTTKIPQVYGAISVKKVSMLEESNWGTGCSDTWTIPKSDNDEAVNALAKSWNLYTTREYSTENCMGNCFANMYLWATKVFGNDTLGGYTPCVPLRYAVVNHTGLPYDCTAINISDAINFIGHRYKLSGVSTVEGQWTRLCNCGVRCQRTDYDIQMSTSSIPSPGSKNEALSRWGVDEEYVKENMVVLVLYMKNAFYEMHTQAQAITRLSVISEIGGSMGLFMGVSLITLAEILIFLTKTCWGLMFRGRRQTRAIKRKQIIEEMQQADELKFKYGIDVSDFETVYDGLDWYADAGENFNVTELYEGRARSRTLRPVIEEKYD